jgi:hypothetical protein
MCNLLDMNESAYFLFSQPNGRGFVGLPISHSCIFLAIPGGVRKREVRPKPPFAAVMKAVKNIARLVRVYRVKPGEITGTSNSAAGWRTQRRVVAWGSLIGLAILATAVALPFSGVPQKTATADNLSPVSAQAPAAAIAIRLRQDQHSDAEHSSKALVVDPNLFLGVVHLQLERANAFANHDRSLGSSVVTHEKGDVPHGDGGARIDIG